MRVKEKQGKHTGHNGEEKQTYVWTKTRERDDSIEKQDRIK